MNMIRPRGRPDFLDRKECFDLWVELGSILKVRKELARRGKINPTTKKMPSDSGVRIAALKYILYNLEDARKVFKKLGYFGDDKDKEWFEYLKSRALDVLTTRKSRYEEWENDILQKYARGLEKDH